MHVNNKGRQCSFDSCPLPATTAGLCGGHYEQKRRGKELTPLKWSKGGKTCTGPECNDVATAKGLCAHHRRQQRQGKELTPKRRKGPIAYWEDGKKLCPGCGAVKDSSEYRNDNTRGTNPYDYMCKGCRKWKAIQYRHGVSRADWELIIEFQGGGCAVCGEKPNDTGSNLVVEHDHSCCSLDLSSNPCCHRGIACRSCNWNVDRSTLKPFALYRERYASLSRPLIEVAREWKQAQG